MMAKLAEEVYLPAQGLMILEMTQRFTGSTKELLDKVGPKILGRAPHLEDIQGHFDIKFVGSSQIESKDMQLQFLERAFQVFGSIPGAAPLFPWGEAMAKWLKSANLRELEAMVANPSGVEDFIQRSQAVAPNNPGNSAGGNNTTPRLAPAGLLPAQAAGAAQ